MWYVVILENAFSQKNILLPSFQVFKTYSKVLARRLDTSKWYLRLSWVGFCSRDSVVAVNQTRFQEYKVFRNKRFHHTYKKLATKYEHLQKWSG